MRNKYCNPKKIVKLIFLIVVLVDVNLKKKKKKTTETVIKDEKCTGQKKTNNRFIRG
ncbi:hypothetical protein ABFS83_11G090900 [Erythranthe nasuta]